MWFSQLPEAICVNNEGEQSEHCVKGTCDHCSQDQDLSTVVHL